MENMTDEEVFALLTSKIEELKQAQISINDTKAELDALQKELANKQVAYDTLEIELQKFMESIATK
ncbi:hypothetical protein EQG49_03080 [Periweissella cryptocerci]|uniref:Uncharacterized protein n=1 Tax=Periweissella cryptocerci TaxID=2506420 RepID=A0A4P6YS59_9LACO|nr:hypothetical protein [Periweissella cryptocerci]QBO35509.1 hypothetical protein EQG49_03080 [Periweissella cryptocerci]